MKASVLAVAFGLGVAPMAANAGDFDGLYFGANVGYGFGSSDVSTQALNQWSVESAALRDGFEALMSPSLDPNGFTFGAQAGYNHGLGSNALVGLEIDYAFLNSDDSLDPGQTPTPFGPTPTYAPVNSVDADHLLALKAKLGFTNGSWLFYATGGPAIARVSGAAEVLSSGGYSKAGDDTEWVSGFVYGGGIEAMLGGNWSARVEYLRGDFADFEYETAYRTGSTFQTTPPYSELVTQDFDTNLVRVGLNLHF